MSRTGDISASQLHAAKAAVADKKAVLNKIRAALRDINNNKLTIGRVLNHQLEIFKKIAENDRIAERMLQDWIRQNFSSDQLAGKQAQRFMKFGKFHDLLCQLRPDLPGLQNASQVCTEPISRISLN